MARTIERYLDARESLFPPTQFHMVAMEYEGRLETAVLSHALRLLCAEHPVLRGRIRSDSQGKLLYVTPDYYPELIVIDGDEGTLLREVASPWDTSLGVVRVVLIRGDSRGYVAWCRHHSVGDGAAWSAIFERFWCIYTDIVDGKQVSINQSDSLPRAPCALLRARWGGSETDTSARTDGFDRRVESKAPVKPEGSKIRNERVRLTREETRALLESARAHKVSAHGLIYGAILVSLRARSARANPEPMQYNSAVDLRRRVIPQISPTEITNGCGHHIGSIMVPLSADPIDIGRTILIELDRALSRKELLIAGSLIPETAANHRPFLAITAVSNMGVIPRWVSRDDLTITDCLINPLFSDLMPSWWHGAYTFRGRLSVVCIAPCSLADEELALHAERVRNHLLKIAERSHHT